MEENIMEIYAIIKTGGKQVKVQIGESIMIEKLKAEAGETVQFHEVVAVSNGKELVIGKPLVDSAVVTAEVQKQGRGKKIQIFRTKAKSNWARRQGHRQPYTRLIVKEIVLDGAVVAK